MGDLITSKDIDKAREVASQVMTPSATPFPKELNLADMNAGVKDLKELISSASELIDKVISLKEARQSTGNVIKSQPPQNSNASPIAKEIIETAKKIDRTKLKAVIENAIKNQSKMIPHEILERKIGEFVGDNFQKVEYEFLGQKFGSEAILVLTTNILADVVDGINEAK